MASDRKALRALLDHLGPGWRYAGVVAHARWKFEHQHGAVIYASARTVVNRRSFLNFLSEAKRMETRPSTR